MCGIAGTLSPHANHSIDNMLDALHHRGRDDRQQWRGSGIALGVQRLAIVDRQRGRQPFISNGVVAVCNGEIYNHVSLRKSLEELGHKFTTQCDVEVILHAYKEWGSGFTRRLRGQFAFAIWDNRKQRLMLARDRYGIVPLVYTRMGGGFTFSSEIKALLQVTGVQRRVNRRAVDDFLSMRYAPGPETFFEGIFQLEPGFMLLIDREGAGISRTWAEPTFVNEYSNPFASIEDATNVLDEALQKSVQRRLQGEVPMGMYLSGGLDSALVGQFAYGAARERNISLSSFSHGFDGKTDEIQSARKVAKVLGTQTEEVLLGNDLMRELPNVVKAVESPVANSDILGLWALAKHASRSVKVVLCGEGADELFASYPHQQLLLDLLSRSENWRGWASKALQKIPPSWFKNVGPYAGALSDPVSVARLLHVLENDETGDRYDQLTSLFTSKEREQLYTREMRTEMDENPGKRKSIIDEFRYLRSHDDIIQVMCEIKMRYFLPDYHLGRENRIAMAFGMEARYPFLDEDVVQSVVQLGYDFKVGKKKPKEKHLLRQVAKRHLPRSIAHRKKGPVRVPIPLFTDAFNEMKQEYLRPKRIRKRGIIRPDAVESLLRRETLSPFMVQRQIFAIMMLEIWFDTFKVSS